MNTKSVIGIIIVVIIVVLVAFWLWKAPSTPQEPASVDAAISNAAPSDTMAVSESPEVAPAKPSSGTAAKIISTKTINGMKIEITKEGTGEPIKNGQTAVMLYTGTLADGSVFDSTANHGNQPFSFSLGVGQVIKGWDEGIVGMKVGEERTLIIPADLAYGPNGYPPVIPANATLTFQVTLVAIK